MRLHEVLGLCCRVILKLILVMKLPLRKSLKVGKRCMLLLSLMIAYLIVVFFFTSNPNTWYIFHRITLYLESFKNGIL